MTQHEYIFIAVSIILGLAITRLLHTMAMITRAYRRVIFHWSSVIWAFSIMLYILQLWWVGWELRVIEQWSFIDFIVLVFGSAALYGAAEMALTSPDEGNVNMLENSQDLGRLSALSMLLYFLVGPYVNIFMYNNAVFPSLAVPSIGILLMAFVIFLPARFGLWSVLFALYSVCVLLLTI
ncbi:MAG: hypothetical protein O2948_05935 [Proteobacteria bacterium]|jgi:hypothetical protein|nr:hypothetical protein [Pseudomonadota bacterium]MDA0929338.1 hypothetical protein [Pseudomonadota bacterium]